MTKPNDTFQIGIQWKEEEEEHDDGDAAAADEPRQNELESSNCFYARTFPWISKDNKNYDLPILHTQE